MSDHHDSVLAVESLHVTFDTPDGPLYAVNGVTLHVGESELLAILGESGSGKSATARTVMGILPMPPGRIRSGAIHYMGRDLTKLSQRERRSLMGTDIAWVPQNPLSSLNPSFRIGRQIVEAIRTHERVSRSEAYSRAVDLLESVGLPEPVDQMRRYPHELSGGMQQRVLIAIAIAPSPKVLIADEPTTALDVTIQAEIVTLLRKIQRERQMSVILITHDCALAGAVADRVAIMYAGRIVETGPTGEVFSKPGHPYTRGLLESTPSLALGTELEAIPGSPPKLMSAPTECSYSDRCPLRIDRCNEEVPPRFPIGSQRESACFRIETTMSQDSVIAQYLANVRSNASTETLEPEAMPVMEGRGLVKVFPVRSGWKKASVSGGVRAVAGVDFQLHEQETLCVVGESGSGKTTLARMILGLEAPTEGSVLYRGKTVIDSESSMPRALRREIQMVAQDPYSSLDRRMHVGDIVSEGWRIHRGIVPPSDWDKEASRLLERVGIHVDNALRRFPHEFSGGQCQRIAIARALALRPAVLVLDEPVSSLDVSVQAQVLSLLNELQEEHGLAYIFIAHDLSVVEYLATKILVMKSGSVVESGRGRTVLQHPQHPYTDQLRRSSPTWIASGRATIEVAESA